MDVVRSNLKKINGTIELESSHGRGTTVWLHLPLTLAILPVLLVQVDEETYALPLRSIIETSRFEPESVHEVEGREVICLRSQTLPLIRLQQLFNSTASHPHTDEKKVVILAIGETHVALLVDRLVGQESTVLKPLSYLNHCPGVAGATVDGEGRVRLVLDPAGLLAAAAEFTPQGTLP